jgi:hypothetical protein
MARCRHAEVLRHLCAHLDLACALAHGKAAAVQSRGCSALGPLRPRIPIDTTGRPNCGPRATTRRTDSRGVKREGEKPLPISLSYININTFPIVIFLEQECSYPPFTFTLHFLSVGQVPKRVGKFFGGFLEIARGGGREREVGERVFAESAAGDQGIVGRPPGGCQNSSVHPPIVFLRAAEAVLETISKALGRRRELRSVDVHNPVPLHR